MATLISDVEVGNDCIRIELEDGRTIEAPLAWFPRLRAAPDPAALIWELCAGGSGVHFPEVDEDIGVDGLLRGRKAAA